MQRALPYLALVVSAVAAPAHARAQTSELPPPAPFTADVVIERPPPAPSPWGYPELDPDRDRVLELLRARRFDDLQRLLDTYERKVLTQDIRWEVTLLQAYDWFYGPDKDVGPLLEEWVARSPGSAESHVARAEFFLARTWEARGTGWAADIESEQWRAVRAHKRRAQDDAAEAVRLDPRNLAAHDVRIRTLLLDGWSSDMENAVDEALERFPASYAIRVSAMSAMTPRWGGSYRLMERFAREADAYASQNPRLRVLSGAVLEERGRTLREDGKDAEALETLERAGQYGPDWNLHYERGRVWYGAHDYVRALAEFNRAIALHPRSYSTLERRGRALAHIAQDLAPPERRVELLTAAEADLALAVRLRVPDADLQEWLDWVSNRKVACATSPTTCLEPSSASEDAAPPPPSAWESWAGRMFMFVLGIPFTLWAILGDLNRVGVGPVPWAALAILFWSFLEWRRQRYWTPAIVHVMAGLAVLLLVAINAAWLTVGGSMWTQRFVVIVICGLVPYVVYLLFLGPRFLGRRREREAADDRDDW